MRLVVPALLLCAAPLGAQWTNRYPKNAGFAHHVYLEGYELPILANGPLDVAAAPDGATLAFASRGWLWRFDVASGVATRLTSGAGVDSRPAWAPDGRRLAFVRDDGSTLAVMIRHVDTGAEVEVDRGMALDPAFTADGQAIVYANATPQGDLDLYRYTLATREKARLTQELGLELRPLPLGDGRRMVYTSKIRAAGDQVRLRRLSDGREQVLLSGHVLSQLRPALSPDGRHLAFSWPGTQGWELRLASVDRPGVSILLVSRPRGRPVAPAWSADGKWIYYSEGDRAQQMRLWRVGAAGGSASEVPVARWDWGVPTARFIVRTSVAGAGPSAARLNVVDASGHPVIPSAGMTRFDGQNGRPFFYSSGTVELEAPEGRVTVRATRGLATPEEEVTGAVDARGGSVIDLTLTPLWRPVAAGWYSGDHHFHLNYGGPFDLAPEDLVPAMQGEDLDVGTPMLANLHNRFEDQDQWGWRSTGKAPMIAFAQEVRSHFLGHVGLIGTRDLFWPWTWGPGYEVFGRDDRTNAEPLGHARRQGGLGMYVHPTTATAPFTDDGLGAIPIGLVADAVLGHVDLLELACLWASDIGTTDIWYRLLNAGIPVMPSAGTDVMTDLYRTMALGATRVYVRPVGALTWESYLAALKAGRSFVTTGPLVDFALQPPGSSRAAGPGDSIAPTRQRVKFTVTVYSALPLDSVNLVVNGRTVAALGKLSPSGVFKGGGSFNIPSGGWVALRVVGPPVNAWPSMSRAVFAHTAPTWIGARGSTEPAARRAAAGDLLRALGNAEQRLVAGYGNASIPNLRAHFTAARAKLVLLAAEDARAGTPRR